MTRACIAVLTLAAACGVCLLPSSESVILTNAQLSSHNGGTQYYCSTPVVDADAFDCDECQSDGNGMYIKCITSFVNKKHQYTVNQAPSQIWDYDLTDCMEIFPTDGAKKYSDPGCENEVATLDCHRKYTAASLFGSTPHVACPDPTGGA